jgi:hypothetical protein
MRGHDEEAAVQADAYIDALLAGSAQRPAPLPDAQDLAPELQQAAELLHARLPRFHPSFAFEEELARRLRAAGDPPSSRAELVRLPLPVVAHPVAASIDRRWLVGGAIASGVSIAGAMLVRVAHNRRGRGRARREWLS